MTTDDWTNAILDDARLQRFQRAASAYRNGEIHVFVERLAPAESLGDPAALLRAALTSRRVDRAILHQSNALEWSHDAYAWEWIVAGCSDPSFVRPDFALTLTPAEPAAFRGFLTWMLMNLVYPDLGLEEVTATTEALVDGALAAMLGHEAWTATSATPARWRCWRLKPDFLNESDGMIVDEATGQPAFFDSIGQNYAWLGLDDDRLVLVLVPVYPSPISFDERWEMLRSLRG